MIGEVVDCKYCIDIVDSNTNNINSSSTNTILVNTDYNTHSSFTDTQTQAQSKNIPDIDKSTVKPCSNIFHTTVCQLS